MREAYALGRAFTVQRRRYGSRGWIAGRCATVVCSHAVGGRGFNGAA